MMTLKAIKYSKINAEDIKLENNLTLFLHNIYFVFTKMNYNGVVFVKDVSKIKHCLRGRLLKEYGF